MRCWAHLKRKAQGLVDSLNPAAQGFGLEVLALWNDLWGSVQTGVGG